MEKKGKATKIRAAGREMSLWRILALFGFGAAGALLLGSLSDEILNVLYQRISGFITKAPPAGGYQGNAILNAIPFMILGAILGGFVGTRVLTLLEQFDAKWGKMEIGDKVNVFLGAFVGFVGSVPFLVLFLDLSLEPHYKALLVTIVIFGLSTLSIYMLQSIAEVLPWSRVQGRGKRSGAKLLDTNVIIDGRIYEVARNGFLEGEIYVPGFVLDELQYIADSHDALRRQRGRRGLEVLRHMQAEFPLEVRVHDRLAPDAGDGVDGRLVRLAKAIGADIVTNDWNLNRVADLQGIRVLNLNELSIALRTNVLPNETLELTVIREGNQSGQGVGYLEDGTMVVVENGKPFIGETLEVTVTQVIQTERGKMIFGKAEGVDEPRQDPPQPPPRRSSSRSRQQTP
ncbi:MAG TPA: TRAM domain-containing protein [Fimbriimonas sp.]